nr:Abi family protein [Desulfobulbus alkaliphilus]
MIIPNRSRASRYLSHISYYRLRGYWIPLEQSGSADHTFQNGTTFDQVLDLYIFDRQFRLLVMEAIERFEVSLRAQYANQLGYRYGSHFFLETRYFADTITHNRLLTSLGEEIDRSREPFIDHYRQTYSQPYLPPIWASCEVMSFGQLSQWYQKLRKRGDRQFIAKSYGLDEKFLRSFLHHLTHVRNITAHHGRLWNRRFTITMALPKAPIQLAAMLHPGADRYVGNTIIVLGYLLKLISPGTSWPWRMRRLIEHLVGINPVAMGLANDWQTLPLWIEEEQG